MPHKQTWKTGDQKQTKLASYTDRTKFKKPKQTQTNSNEFDIKKVNPFLKKIDRHYGSFKTRIAGNYLKKFNSLSFNQLKPLGKQATGCRRKILRNPSFTALFYSNGTVEIKPSRDIGLSPDALQESFFQKAKKAVEFLEGRGVFLAPLSMNRKPKYGVEDSVARKIGQEFKGAFRGMDKSPNHGHVDNFGARSCKRDLRLSDEQHEWLARARVNNPELLVSLESKINTIFEADVRFAKNLDLHLEILQAIKEALRRAMRPSRHRFPTSAKRSATYRGVC